MLLQAMADQFGLPVTEYADTAFKAELAPKFSYGCAVFLDTDRVNFQKEGFPKEELLAGLAQVLPKNVWQYVVQIPRLASLGQQVRAARRHAVQPRRRQGPGRLHQGARARTREVFVHPHTGEAGAIGAAIETLRVATSARGKSSLHRHRGDARARVHDQERRRDRLSLLPERVQAHLHRHARARTARTAATSRGFSCEKGTVESKEAMLDAGRPSARRSPPQFPNLVDYEAKQGVHALLRARAAARRPARRSRTSRSSKGLFRHQARSESRGRSSAPAQRRMKRRKRCASACRACSTSTRRRRSSAPTSRRSASAKRNVVFSDATDRGDVGRGRQVRLDRPVLPEQGARRRTSTTCSSTSTSRSEAPAQLHLLPDPHPRAELRGGHAWTTRRARSSPARRT